jgi:hypothetical protein
LSSVLDLKGSADGILDPVALRALSSVMWCCFLNIPFVPEIGTVCSSR